jgi:hypothetical protein
MLQVERGLRRVPEVAIVVSVGGRQGGTPRDQSGRRSFVLCLLPNWGAA